MCRSIAAALFVGVLGMAGSTFADPLQVTSGSHLQTWDRTWFWQLTGDGFELNGAGITRNSPIFLCDGAPPSCEPGMVLSLDSLMQTGNFGGDYTAEFGGSRYSGIFWDGRLEFESGAIAAAAGTFELPFTFTAALTAYNNAGLTGPPLFSTGPLVGSGTVNVRLFEVTGGEFEIDDVVYTFADPVPEPATMLLLATGLAGGFAVRRRRG